MYSPADLWQVGSRLVLQMTGVLMLVLGIFGKFGAVFITIPEPVIGGMFLVMFGMIAAVGISNLQVKPLITGADSFNSTYVNPKHSGLGLD